MSYKDIISPPEDMDGDPDIYGNIPPVAPERTHLLQATVFIEDAARYREICHRVDKRALQIYRLYHSNLLQRSRYAFIFVLLFLAFFEFPSSLTWTSDIRNRGDRVEVPCGVTEGIELICLLFFVTDVIIK
ncbi:two pore channel protein 2-like, partial [Saccostrea cucullata]|uniref:two pore channel protein 2-like n=1 Tax=Saccostrea cuccullata TaxID=36930 RepID=UPI002ED33CDD